MKFEIHHQLMHAIIHFNQVNISSLILFNITGRYSGFLKDKKVNENEEDKNKKKKKSKKDDFLLSPIVSLTSIIAAIKNLEGKAKVCWSVCMCVCVYVCV